MKREMSNVRALQAQGMPCALQPETCNL